MGVMYKSGKLYGGINTVEVCPVEHRTLLWTNPDPTVAFAAQTIELDLSGYDEIELEYIDFVQHQNVMPLLHIPIGDRGNMNIMIGNNSYSTGLMFTAERRFLVTSTGVEFESGYGTPTGYDLTARTDTCIPRKIYGIKRQNTHMELEQLGIHVSTKEPTVNDGQDGDIWFVYF